MILDKERSDSRGVFSLRKLALMFSFALIISFHSSGKVFANCTPWGLDMPEGASWKFYLIPDNNPTRTWPDNCESYAGYFGCSGTSLLNYTPGGNYYQSCGYASPTGSMYWSPSSISKGQSSTIYSYTTGASSCSTSGSFWNGSAGTSNGSWSGNASPAVYSKGTYYQDASCYNPSGGSVYVSPAYLTVLGDNCSSPWGTVSDGYSNTAYVASSADVCSYQTRTCNDGSMSGSYAYTSCTVNSYSITFNSAGGSAVSTITQAYGTSVTPPTAPTRSGYTFTGWSPTIASTMPSGGQSLTAIWSLNLPTVTTPTLSSLTNTTATLGANLTSGANITARGTCWNTTPSPVANCVAEGATSTGAFTQSRTGLPQGTLIYFRGYATNATGTAYSSDSSTTTLTTPTLTTPVVSLVTNTTATFGSTISSNGGSSITDRGTCWGASPAPVTNCVSEGGTALGAFTHARTSLSQGALIYYRGYATNAYGTSYSPDGSTTTLTSPTLITPTISSMGMATATLGATVSTNGGAVLSARGTCYSTNSASTTLGLGVCAAEGGTSVSAFTQVKTGLTPGTLYYFQGYATNAYGTSYSPQGSFTTQSVPIFSSPSATSIGSTTATLGATISSNGGNTITARGTCFATTAAPLTNCTAEGGTGVGTYTQARTGFTQFTSYYYRGYVSYTDGSGYASTTYGADGTFTTIAVPTVTTPTSASISYTTAVLGANITSDGGGVITARGTCFATTASPITNCTPEGATSTGVFTQARTSLPAGTLIYYRGYATNPAGTTYSADGTFTTLSPAAPVLNSASTTITNIGTSTATISATITDNGGSTITARGTCWATTAAPTTNCVDAEGVEVSSFTQNRTGFTASTTYYVRAYATNGIGTTYSSDVTFSTVNITAPSNVSVTAGYSQVTASYTNPSDANLNSIIVLKDISTITAVPINSTTYTLGNTIGSSVVACIDTTVISGATDACVSAGLTNGTPYYFKVFAKNNTGNYSPGVTPSGSPATPSISTTLGNGTNPSDSTIAPGGSAVFVDSFTLQTATTSEVISSMVLAITNASSTSLVEVTNDVGSVVYGSVANPTGATTSVTLSTNTLTANTSLTQYKIRITPKSQVNLPSGVLSSLYPVTTTVSSWTGAGNTKSGTDSSSAIVTIDNLPPALVTSDLVIQGNTKATANYTVPSDTDFSTVTVLMSTSPITDVPVDGSTYTAGNAIGASTVACVDSQLVPSAVSSCRITGLTNGVPYYFKVFTKDSYGNYSAGDTPTASPLTPNILSTSVSLVSYRLRNDNGNETSATYSSSENTGNTSNFILGDKTRVRFVIANQTGLATTKSYQVEYATGACTSWTPIPRKLDATYQHWKIEPSSYVADNAVTTHSSGLSVPNGKTFVPGRIQTFSRTTQPITLQSNEYTEVEFSLRSTGSLQTDTNYCFRLTNQGEDSDFIYSQTLQISPLSRLFRFYGGGGGGGYSLVGLENGSTATTTSSGGGASSTQATSTPGGDDAGSTATTTTSTSTPSHGGGGGDVGYLFNNKNLFTGLNTSTYGAVLGDTTVPICLGLQNNISYGSVDEGTQGEVSQLQFYLRQQGYLSANVTGRYLILTKKAVEEFQKDNKIYSTGYTGKMTRVILKKKSCIE